MMTKMLMMLFLLTITLIAEAETIESRIDGDFEGWDGGTTFKLTNGQVYCFYSRRLSNASRRNEQKNFRCSR